MSISIVFHRCISLEDEAQGLPKEAIFADNGQRFQTAEMVDFNSLYVSQKFLKRLFENSGPEKFWPNSARPGPEVKFPKFQTLL